MRAIAGSGWRGSLRTRVKSNRVVRTGAFVVQNGVHLLRARPGPPVTGATPRYTLAAMIRVKDEARFLPEWLAHHVGLGVEHVVVYDNDSSDGTQAVIDPFVAEGLVTYVPWPTVPASPSSHLDFFARFGPTCEWAAFFDADEFLVETTPGALERTLASASARGVPAVAVNWRFYGSSGHETIPPGLVTERFDRAAAGYNHHVKVIARPAQFAGWRNPHNFYYRRGRLARTPEGRRVFGSFVTPADRPALVLHHYVYRSREDYERKTRRGFAEASGIQERKRRLELAAAEFPRHNEVVAPVPEATRQATAELLQKLGYPEDLYR